MKSPIHDVHQSSVASGREFAFVSSVHQLSCFIAEIFDVEYLSATVLYKRHRMGQTHMRNPPNTTFPIRILSHGTCCMVRLQLLLQKLICL